jgi:adenylate cyclase class 2
MHPAPIEREVKLRFTDAAQARAAISRLGATPLRDRRLQEDCLLDTADQTLRTRRSALRVRVEAGKSRVTFKGPIQAGPMKVREELETLVGDGEVLLQILAELGFRPWFRYQKFREEYALPEVVVALDETPIGTFVELEGSEAGIDEVARRLGRTRADYVLQSYYGLFDEWRGATGSQMADMVFDRS